MSAQHFLASIYQHANPSNFNDPRIGFWIYLQPCSASGVATTGIAPAPASSAQIAAVSPDISQPFTTLALAQAVITSAKAFFAAQTASSISTVTDTQVAAPVFLG